MYLYIHVYSVRLLKIKVILCIKEIYYNVCTSNCVFVRVFMGPQYLINLASRDHKFTQTDSKAADTLNISLFNGLHFRRVFYSECYLENK